MLTENQLRAQISTIRHSSNNPQSVIGIAVPARWTGQAMLQVDGQSYRLLPADTELELRAALLEQLPEGVHPVVLTTLEAKDLGEDLQYRFARRRIHNLSPKDILCDLFGVRDIDPQLRNLRWMASALSDARPENGYPPPPQGTLDQETAWAAFLQRKLEMVSARPDLPALIAWARLPVNGERWRKLEPEAAQAVEEWLARSAGAESAWVWAALRKNTEISVLTLGLVAVLLFRRTDIPTDIATARGSFEVRYFDGLHLAAEAGKVFASATLIALRPLDASAPDLRAEMERADTILSELRVEARAIDSEVSLLGWRQRVAAFGRAVRTWLKTRTSDDLLAISATFKTATEHWAAVQEFQTIEQMEMALRLCRWLAQTPTASAVTGFVANCRRYVDELGFVDWSRYLLFHGHSQEELNLACDELVSMVGEQREQLNREFANALSEWTAAGSSSGEVGLIESVLAERVAPLAKVGSVLMIVLDGLSFAVYRQIAAGLVRENWAEAVPAGQVQSIPVVAGLPTVTEWSRRLLLSGRTDLAPGADEVAAFRDAPAFQGIVKTNSPALLFRKGELTDFGGRSVSELVRQEITSSTRQVVGVVINAIDDHLAKDDQLRVAWPLSAIPILQQVLELARSAGRYVVIASDHGHVVTHRAQLLCAAPNDRYRLPTGEPLSGEIRLNQGRGTTFAKGGIFVPWTERGYYTSRRNGLHGGITPQEVLVPATVFVPSNRVPDGWTLIPQCYPDWWWEGKVTAAPLPPVPATPIPTGKKTKATLAAESTLPLFAGIAAPPPADWIDALFASPLYQEQYSRVGRNPPNPETVKRVLLALRERQGTMLKSVLAQCSGEPEIRLPGLLAMLRRILNVEGYPVLGLDEVSGTVRLNLDLLRTQFDLTA
jgi:hypothetical protein